jgi:hypothetical protein
MAKLFVQLKNLEEQPDKIYSGREPLFLQVSNAINSNMNVGFIFLFIKFHLNNFPNHVPC